MTYFKDLTPYAYIDPEEELPDTINIGWLDKDYPFPVGETSDDFRAKLRALCEHRLKQTRGFHSCQFCKGRDRATSSSEMRIAHDGKVYAAPSMVYHYVVEHGYFPPEEFIDAVLASDV